MSFTSTSLLVLDVERGAEVVARVLVEPGEHLGVPRREPPARGCRRRPSRSGSSPMARSISRTAAADPLLIDGHVSALVGGIRSPLRRRGARAPGPDPDGPGAPGRPRNLRARAGRGSAAGRVGLPGWVAPRTTRVALLAGVGLLSRRGRRVAARRGPTGRAGLPLARARLARLTGRELLPRVGPRLRAGGAGRHGTGRPGRARGPASGTLRSGGSIGGHVAEGDAVGRPGPGRTPRAASAARRRGRPAPCRGSRARTAGGRARRARRGSPPGRRTPPGGRSMSCSPPRGRSRRRPPRSSRARRPCRACPGTALCSALAVLDAPSASVMPYSVTIARATLVAFSMSLAAPVVGSWKTSSSAARPPSM
jgi:hypothetical protein